MRELVIRHRPATKTAAVVREALNAVERQSESEA
jgi:hypothetical protein